MSAVFKGRPVDPSGRADREIRVYDFLDSLGVEYDRVDHDPAMTMALCEDYLCKNLFLCNRQKTRYFLLLMPGSKKFLTKDLSSQINSARLSFADEADMLRLLDVAPGSVSVMGLMNDRGGEVQLLIDRDILDGQYIGCHPCMNTSSLKIRTQDFIEDIIPALRHEPIFVTL